MSRTITPGSCAVALAGLLWLLPLGGCSGKQDPGQTAPQDTMGSAGAQSDLPAEPPPESGTVAGTETSSAPAATSKPASAAPSKAPASPGTQAAEPPQTPQKVAEPATSPPAGIVAVPATKPGITRVGPEKCKLCHRLQYDSWAATAHAARTPPLDCESCHGPGSEYRTIAIMKDIEKARAAGLVIPKKSFCTENCHTDKWQDDMLQRTHAHKVKAVQG